MFHKPGSSLGVGPNKKKSMDVALKKSDRRALRQAAENLMEETCREECSPILHQAFMEGSLLQRKLSLPDGKILLYTRNASDGWPYDAPQVIFISLDDGEKKWIHAPSVALLALLPANSFPTVTIVANASKNLCRGAQLMRAGMRSLPSFGNTAGVVAVCIHGNPQPMAVGRLTRDTTMPESIGPDTKGVGVEIWSCYGDDIWRSQFVSQLSLQEEGVVSPTGGARFNEGNYGNVGFLDGKLVAPIVSLDQDDEQGSESGEKDIDESEEKGENATIVSSQQDSQFSTEPQQPDSGNHSEQDLNTSDIDDNVNKHDLVLHDAVCKALVLLKKSDLPMTTANFYAQHVLPQRTEQIQLKKTTYKKLGKYLEEQTHRNLITCGPDKAKKDLMAYVTSVNRGHPDLKPYRQEQQKENDSSKTSSSKKMAIVNLFVVPNHLVSLMRLDQDDVKAANAKTPERRGTGMLTTPEARAILDNYIAANELIVPARPDQVTVDGPLCDALYKKLKGNYPTQVSRKDITKAWLAKMGPAYALVEMPGNHVVALSRGKPPKVSIEVSMRQGRKYVTRVRGLEEFGIDAMEFSKDVAKRFACSATAEHNPVGRAALKKGHVELVFQGHLVEELRALLLGDESLTSHGGAKGGNYSVPKNVIEVTLKRGVPAKKRK